MTRFHFIDQERAHCPVNLLCGLLRVSRSGFALTTVTLLALVTLVLVAPRLPDDASSSRDDARAPRARPG